MKQRNDRDTPRLIFPLIFRQKSRGIFRPINRSHFMTSLQFPIQNYTMGKKVITFLTLLLIFCVHTTSNRWFDAKKKNMNVFAARHEKHRFWDFAIFKILLDIANLSTTKISQKNLYCKGYHRVPKSFFSTGYIKHFEAHNLPADPNFRAKLVSYQNSVS